MQKVTFEITIETEHPPAVEELRRYIREACEETEDIFLDTKITRKEIEG